MKRAALIALVVCFVGLAHAREIALGTHERVSLPYPGAIAVFALDASVADVSTNGREVILLGRRGGRTLVTVVMHSSTETLELTVEPPPVMVSEAELAARDHATVDARYDSGLKRFATSVGAKYTTQSATVTTRADAYHDLPRDGEPGKTALPFASVAVDSRLGRFVLLDELILGPKLLLDQATVRGVHAQVQGVSVHAGVASSSRFDDLIVPGSGDRVVAASVEIPQGDLRIVPAAAWLPDSASSTRAAATLGVVRGHPGDRLFYAGELGWGGRPGGAIDVQLLEPARQAWLSGVVRPNGFAALKATGRPPGRQFDGGWNESVGDQTVLGFTFSDNRLDLPGLRSEASSARFDWRLQLDPHMRLDASLGGGTYLGASPDRLRRETFAAGAAYDGSGFGVAAQYRYQDTSISHGGHGGRVSFNASGARWRASGFVDAQQQAPSVDVILSERSDIARALAELGLSASNPEELVGLLRSNAQILSAAGVSVGNLRTNPLRLQGGLDVAWRPDRFELGGRLIAEQVESVASRRVSFVATAYANWRVGRDTDVGISYSRWAMRRSGLGDDERGSIQLWVRKRFDDFALPGLGTAAITGRVVRDAGETEASAAPPLAGVEVVLDRMRRTRTSNDGTFAFDNPGAGAHRIEAVLPAQPGAYFASPSMLPAKPGEELRFALAFSQSFVAGRVTSDAGEPIEGVSVRLEGANEAAASTDSSGRYRIVAAPGSARLTIVGESVPPGYELRDLATREVMVDTTGTVTADFRLRTQRTVAGRLIAWHGAAHVRVLETGQEVAAASDGRFVLRGVPAGKITLMARDERGEARRNITLDADPGAVTRVEISMSDPKFSVEPVAR